MEEVPSPSPIEDRTRGRSILGKRKGYNEDARDLSSGDTNTAPDTPSTIRTTRSRKLQSKDRDLADSAHIRSDSSPSPTRYKSEAAHKDLRTYRSSRRSDRHALPSTASPERTMGQRVRSDIPRSAPAVDKTKKRRGSQETGLSAKASTGRYEENHDEREENSAPQDSITSESIATELSEERKELNEGPLRSSPRKLPYHQRSQSQGSLSSDLSELSSNFSSDSKESGSSESTNGSNTIKKLAQCNSSRDEGERQKVLQHALEICRRWKDSWMSMDKRVQANLRKRERNRLARLAQAQAQQATSKRRR